MPLDHVAPYLDVTRHELPEATVEIRRWLGEITLIELIPFFSGGVSRLTYTIQKKGRGGRHNRAVHPREPGEAWG